MPAQISYISKDCFFAYFSNSHLTLRYAGDAGIDPEKYMLGNILKGGILK